LTRVIAHRGASAYQPENSRAAFRAARDLGADGVELDVHATSDGIFVVHHDDTAIGRRIADVKYEELEGCTLSNGEPLPTLSDALIVLGDLEVFIEVKALAERHDPVLLGTLDCGPAPSHYRVHSFDHRIVRRLTARRPDLPGGVLSVSYPISPLRQLEEAGATVLWQQERMIDAELVAMAHRAGYQLYAWTVDDPERIRQLSSLGVDAVCTNKPDVAREAVQWIS